MFTRRSTLQALTASALWSGASIGRAAVPAAPGGNRLLTMDLVYANPGGEDPETSYLDPRFLVRRGYDATVIEHAIEGTVLFQAYDPGLFPDSSDEAILATKRRAEISQRIRLSKASGLKVFAWVQYLALPRRLLERHGARMVDSSGRVDVRLPATQEIVRAFTAEIFAHFPQLDGMIVRTGEIYLHDLPYHGVQPPSGADATEDPIQGGTAITHGEQSHRALLTVLRDEVCVKANKALFYRTWDFGNNFHNNPKYYLNVTDSIAPHENLYFSIKHQRGDFHRLTPFNPALGIGRHRQVVEVQCQMEAYGKGAYPYYVAQGVIEGWEEYEWLMPEGAPRSLREVASDPRTAGIWTWSRGGGWDGPYIKDELWCDQNAFVLSTYAKDTSRSESSIFDQYSREVLGLNDTSASVLRDVCIKSARAVLRGQLSNLGAEMDVWWARDDTLSAPPISDFLSKGLTEAAIAEKETAVTMWREIAAAMPTVRFATPGRQAFAEASAQYGLYRHAIIAEGWTAVLLAAEGRLGGASQTDRIREAIARYDELWAAWRDLKANNPMCSSLPKPLARGDEPGLGAAIDALRTV